MKKNRRLENVKYEFKNNKQAIFAAIYLVVIILVSIFVVFINIDPDAIDVVHKLQPPSSEHWFGTDEMGRDYLMRVLYGGRVSLVVGVLAMLTSILIGIAVGMSAGYFGGIVDNILMRIVDVFSSIPWIIMVTVVGLLFKRGIVSIIIVIGLFSWMEIARLVRSEVLSAKEREYVQYSKFIGVNAVEIMVKHVLPSVFPTIITAATAAIASAIMVESSLSFLGLGVAAPMSSWGSLLQSSQQYLQKAPYMAILPGVLIILTVYSFNKLGDVLRVFVEPKITAGEKNE
ncbi:ABC transporter permease [Coprococcus sp. AF21-14LB]|uniref:ABC transporter permease n=1 Tax=Coprococcus sp. AF21-14LB TaxID=2292231 RepID=UPI000E4A74DB|nr:ABC transporter permease [Coprococcus sp. AF21-14LB]QUO31197.1 ABC transporter permease [Faecalicatena sp. Marseille-Q4148]RGS81897.1 ABC transporter permease [Coprococcus sp. AF21-14LB]